MSLCSRVEFTCSSQFVLFVILSTHKKYNFTQKNWTKLKILCSTIEFSCSSSFPYSYKVSITLPAIIKFIWNPKFYNFSLDLLGVEVHKVLLKDLISGLVRFAQVLQDLRNSKLNVWQVWHFSLSIGDPVFTFTYILPTYCWHFSGFIL